jgi:hypothetical protein
MFRVWLLVCLLLGLCVADDTSVTVSVNIEQEIAGCLTNVPGLSDSACNSTCGCFNGTYNETAALVGCALNFFSDVNMSGDKYSYYFSIMGFVNTDYAWVALNRGRFSGNMPSAVLDTSCWRERLPKKVCYLSCFSKSEAVVGKMYTKEEMWDLCYYDSVKLPIMNGGCDLVYGENGDTPLDLTANSMRPPNYKIDSSPAALLSSFLF